MRITNIHASLTLSVPALSCTEHKHTCLHTDITDRWYRLLLYIGGNDNIYEPDTFSQRSAVGYWWVSLCTITYEWKEGRREREREIEMKRRYRCYSHIPWTIFHQSLWLETLVVVDRTQRASLTQRILSSFFTLRLLSWAVWLKLSPGRPGNWKKRGSTLHVTTHLNWSHTYVSTHLYFF